ncbi:Rieske [2Fe-2S] domain-containing protein [Aquiflexum balticum DSM 16537]|uniref:Rieske [2Fe-2S] domain-containing protein n=2 Tax=Aquiflexum TaxID=280472 RepID=A0A1W2H206_9BACT|nr:Rieske [2Fe-2S] domain-containing protein [Aquiflexum balticum DSM 16537]
MLEFTIFYSLMKTFVLGDNKEQVLELIPNKKIKTVQLGATKVCVTRDGEEFFVFETLCPHRKASLNQGFINGMQEVVCHLHEYRFDLRTGQVTSGSCPDLKIFQSELTENGLKIQI